MVRGKEAEAGLWAEQQELSAEVLALFGPDRTDELEVWKAIPGLTPPLRS